MSRKTRVKAGGDLPPPPPSLKIIRPVTINQSRVFKAFNQGRNILIHGYAGTGKSFIAIWLALNEVINKGTHKHLIIVRSAVPSRKVGFLPGTDEEKSAIYELPYRSIVDDLYSGRGGNYQRLKDAKVIDFTSTSFLRGITMDNAIIVIDEVQNLTDGEINTVMTRVGNNSRVLILGDFRQNDLSETREESCIGKLLRTLMYVPSFVSIEMEADDIVRSGLVKEWILAREMD